MKFSDMQLAKHSDFLNCMTPIAPGDFVSERVSELANKIDWASAVWDNSDFICDNIKQGISEHWQEKHS